MRTIYFPPCALLIAVFVYGGSIASAAEPMLHMRAATDRAGVPVLGWDTEGGPRAQTNLLRAGEPLSVYVWIAGQRKVADAFPVQVQGATPAAATYRLTIAPQAEIVWSVSATADSLQMEFSTHGDKATDIQKIGPHFPFDEHVTPTTVLPSQWNASGSLVLPAVISAPDNGQMRLADSKGRHLKAFLDGSREDKTLDFVVELPPLKADESCHLSLTPVRLAPPAGMVDTAMWERGRRAWFGALQPSARWAFRDSNPPHGAVPGLLANNVISDPASISLWLYADQAFWTPQITPDISAAALVRRTVDWWLDEQTHPDGEVIAYTWWVGFLDSNPSVLISAWDYVESTGDNKWLASRIDRLELLADFLARRDIDNDGMVEAKQSGNLGDFKGRSCSWFDAINCGYKDGYDNALIYRAWRDLADLETRLVRSEKQARYKALADHLKATYARTLYNPATGWLAWWKSKDGQLHDYASPFINGLAIEYGLVEPAQGRQILARLRAKLKAVGFNRYDLGLPINLEPVLRGDYIPHGFGSPSRDDGTDTFGFYQNGGVSAWTAMHFFAAHYVVGEPEKADEMLRAMLGRLDRDRFQNGVHSKVGEGMEWVDWTGKPTGYEGYLADNYAFLQAILLREPALRARFYRPLGMPVSGTGK